MTAQNSTLSSLQSQLDQKTEVIDALTAQLEKAVDQLDRLRRSGADRPGIQAPNSARVPDEVAELTGRFEEALDVWFNARPDESLSRIEIGIEQIREMLEGRGIATGSSQASREPAPGADFWESAKARILEEAGPATAEGNDSTANSPTSDADAAELPIAHAVDQVSVGPSREDPPEPVDPPTPISLDANQEALLNAISERDRYIDYLTTRLRIAERAPTHPIDWKALSECPEELLNRLHHLESTLTDQLRRAEVAHALERATLTRERGRLAQLSSELETQARRQSLDNESEQKQEESEPLSDRERRWSRLFSR